MQGGIKGVEEDIEKSDRKTGERIDKDNMFKSNR